MRPVGLESLPMGYTRLEFLESTGTQSIATGLQNKNITVRIKHRPLANGPGSGRPAFGGQAIERIDGTTYYNQIRAYAATNLKGTGYGVEIQYRGQRIGVGLSDLPLGLLTECEVNFKDLYVNCTVYGGGSKTKSIPSDVRDKDLGSLTLCRFNLYYIGYIYSFSANYDGTPAANYIPALDTAGRPCMFDLVTKKPFYNAGTGSDFIAGFTMAQALNLAYLPANTTLTVSLPWEASLVQHNDEVEAALDEAEENGCVLTTKYREPEKDSAIYNKYAECTTFAEVQAVNADYKTDLTIDGAWEYALPELGRADGLFFSGSNLKSFNSELPELSYASYLFYRALRLTGWNIDLPKLTNSRYMFEQTLFTKFAGKLPVLNSASGMFLAGALTDFESDLPALSYGGNMFAGCKLNKTSVLRILNTIPTWTSGDHPLTLGIHIDYQNDEEVLAAIALADIAQTPVADGGKGWTLTIQWNGTPTAQTASTFGLRKPPIYAKLGTVERPDGAIENFLDWGHYVSNAEENGYQEFASIEEAEEYFNINKATEES